MAGTLTVAELEKEVLDNITKSTTGETKSGTSLLTLANRSLNRAQKKIARNNDFLFDIRTASTVADQLRYSFPSDLRAIYSLTIKESDTDLEARKLTLVLPREFDKLIPTPQARTDTGISDWYVPYKTDNTFELFRIPDQAYTLTLRMSYWPATLALSDGSQTSDYTNMDDFLIQWATYLMWYWMQEYRDAASWKALAKETLDDAIKEEESAVPDWVPKGRGFNSDSTQVIGEYWNNPFVRGDLTEGSM